MSFDSTYSNNWTFYVVGLLFIALGIAFLLIPLLASTGALSNVRVPWVILYVYNKGGFYFATSPILIIFSIAALLIFLLKR